MFPWFYFSNAVTAGANAIVVNAFLVKKVAFRVSILPIVPIASAFIIHIFLVGILVSAFVYHGKTPSLYWLQAPYYLACLALLALGLSWLTSALRVFIKDVGNFVAVLIQIGFWATPIFWTTDLIPERYHHFIHINPMAYIVSGYRNTFMHHVWFWEHGLINVYFWGEVATIIAAGIIVFKRLRPHFADVL
jgi:lipopolysaccharide transport system permease protein/teichoic acid transport system permease protein